MGKFVAHLHSLTFSLDTEPVVAGFWRMLRVPRLEIRMHNSARLAMINRSSQFKVLAFLLFVAWIIISALLCLCGSKCWDELELHPVLRLIMDEVQLASNVADTAVNAHAKPDKIAMSKALGLAFLSHHETTPRH
jgi:hypothetical protein